MSKLFGLIAPLGGLTKGVNDDDFVDRLSHTVSVSLMIMFSIVVSTKQYVGEPIACWVPAQFTSGYQDYANKVCWVSNTYYIPFNDDIPHPEIGRKKISYYQWVPMILLVQALLFYLPCRVWRTMNFKSGVDVHSIVEASKSLQDSDNRDKTMRYIIKNIDRYLGSMRNKPKTWLESCKLFFRQSCLIFCGQKFGNYLVLLYIVTKLLYVGNALMQLFMLNFFLGDKYHMYGFDVIQGLLSESEEWSGSERFPRVTLCDFKVRHLGHNIHRHTVQCVLTINLFNEKIFIFVWFWLVFIVTVTIFNLILWIIKVSFQRGHTDFVKRHLKAMSKIKDHDEKKSVHRYIIKYLRPDGVLLFRIIALNVNELIAAEIISELWEYFKSNPPMWDRNRREVDDV